MFVELVLESQYSAIGYISDVSGERVEELGALHKHTIVFYCLDSLWPRRTVLHRWNSTLPSMTNLRKSY